MINNISCKIIIPLIFLLGFLVTETNAQKVKIKLKKEEFTSPANFKKAKKAKNKGLKYYKKETSGSMKKAVVYFEELHQLAPSNIAVNYYLGSSYLNSVQKHRCLKYLRTVYDENPKLTQDLLLKLAQGYHLNYKFDVARNYYSWFNNSLTEKEQKIWNLHIQKCIQETHNGEKYVKEPERVFIDNLGKGINTKYSEYSPVIMPDGKTLYFTARQPDPKKKKTKIFNITEEYYENVYTSRLTKDVWSEAKKFPKPINKSKRNTAIVGISQDGKELIIFNGSDNFGYLEQTQLIEKQNKPPKWSKPTKKPFKKINNKYGITSASISYDGNTLYFSTENPKKKMHGLGGQDIYQSTRIDNTKKWNKPTNLGGIINTDFDETSVFISSDNNSLYFSSDGHTSMGGFDIFKSDRLQDGTWGAPINLGYPINTPDDDMYFSITTNKRFGFFASSGREDTNGDWEIYKITFLGPEKPLLQNNEDLLIASLAKPLTEAVMEKTVEIQLVRLTVVKGKVLDSFDKNPIGAKIDIIDNDTEEVLQVVNSNPETGAYTVNLPSGKNYGMMVTAPNYLFHSENFNIPGATEYQEIIRDILLHSMAAGSKVVLNNISFETGKAILRPSSYPELNYVVKLMNAYPALVIEISGHTDNVGSAASNQKLSENRAKAVVDYLVAAGVPKTSLQFKGYGLTQPIANNKTAEGREQNRRVEFKIIK